MAWDDIQGTGSTISAADWNTMTAYTKSVIATASNIVADDGQFATLHTTGNITTGGTVDGIDIATDVAANTAKDTNVTTNLSLGTVTSTTMDVNSSDGTNATLIAANTDDAGLLTAAKFDEIEANNAKVTNATHTGDVTGSTALTIGADKVLDTHINWGTAATEVSAVDMPIADAGGKITATEVEGALQENRTAIDLNTAASHTQGTDTTLGSGAVAADHGTGSVDQIINVCYGTGSTAPTASTTTEGTLYIQYTA